MQVTQQRVELGPRSLSNEKQLDDLAERHRQLHILATESRSLISFLKGGDPTFDSDRVVSPCLPKTQGDWQVRSYQKTNQPSPVRSRSPSDTSAFSMSSFSQDLEAIPSSSMTGASPLSHQTGVIPSSSRTKVFFPSSPQRETQPSSPLLSHVRKANPQQSEPTRNTRPDFQKRWKQTNEMQRKIKKMQSN